MHSETWVLHTHPATPQGSCPVNLRGTAVTPNMLGRERRKISALLADKEEKAKVLHLFLSPQCHLQTYQLQLLGFSLGALCEA